VVDLEASTPATSDEEAAAARPPLLQFRHARRQRVVACVSGGCASVCGEELGVVGRRRK
jgi:hypothetical protein